MWLRTNLRFFVALVLALATLPAGAHAHGNREHERTVQIPRQIPSATSVRKVEIVAALDDKRSVRRDNCGGAICCDSICVSCCSLLGHEIAVPSLLLLIMRVEPVSGVQRAGCGPERIRRPPKT